MPRVAHKSGNLLASPALMVEISVASQDLAAALECLVRIGHPQDLRIGDLHTCHRLGYPRQELLHLSFYHGWVDPMLLGVRWHLMVHLLHIRRNFRLFRVSRMAPALGW